MQFVSLTVMQFISFIIGIRIFLKIKAIKERDLLDKKDVKQFSKSLVSIKFNQNRRQGNSVLSFFNIKTPNLCTRYSLSKV